MTRLLKIFIFVFSFSLLVLRFLPSTAQASQFMDAMTAPGMNLQKYIIGEDAIRPGGAQGMTSILANGLSTMMLGSYDENGNRLASGGVNIVADLTNNLYNAPPVSGVRYLAYMGSRLHLVSPAFAATPGQDFLKPMIDIWILNRNLAYLFFVIIFVAIGFMIMFRSKLNPQTVVNIQLALPKIIIALILVTFSYAISGFIVDLVFLFNKLIFSIYSSPLKAFDPGPPVVFTTPESLDWLGIITVGFGPRWTSILDSLAKIFSPATLIELAKANISVLFDVIVAFTIFGIALKIFFTLLSKYVTLLIQAIFSPFIFLAAAFPSSQGGLGSFLKSMLSAALAFPAVYFVFILASSIFTFTDPFISLPPLNDAGTLALIGHLQPYIALGILMTAPSIPQMIDSALNVKAPGVDMSQVGGALRKLPIIGSLIG